MYQEKLFSKANVIMNKKQLQEKYYHHPMYYVRCEFKDYYHCCSRSSYSLKAEWNSYDKYLPKHLCLKHWKEIKPAENIVCKICKDTRNVGNFKKNVCDTCYIIGLNRIKKGKVIY